MAKIKTDLIPQYPLFVLYQFYSRMAHTQNRFLIPQLNIIANDAELRSLQRKLLFEQYEKDIQAKKKRSNPKQYLYNNRDNPQNPLYQSKVQLDIERNIREDLAHTYSEQMQKKQMLKKQEKEQERMKQEIMIRRAKQIAQMDRIRAREMHQSFKRQAIEQLNEKQMRKMEQKRRQQEQKQAFQRRYSTNLLSLQKQKSFKEHFHNVNGALEERQRNYMSMVMPMNNLRQREKQKIIQQGIKRSDSQLRQQLRNQFTVAQKHRQQLRDSLTMQIREKEQKKKKDWQNERSEGYTSINYQGRHHPINNPVDFKITHDNKYIMGQLQSGLARSGSKALLQ